MDQPTALRIGEWRVEPASGLMSRDGQSVRLDLRSMRLLLHLVTHAGQVVSIEDLIAEGWDGVAVSPDSVYQAVTSLRRQLGDDSRKPAYIETVPRLGYRLIASVSEWREADSPGTPSAAQVQSQPAGEDIRQLASRKRPFVWGLGALSVILIAAVGVYARLGGASHSAAHAAPPQASIVVMPFLDLTEGMHNEEFADGMTEELIDKLSKVDGLQVPSATASFYYKGKQLSVPEIAETLHVTYILDGSVRKSSGRVRIATRLVRAESSYVVWTETYDRPFDDLIVIQDEIADKVTKALRSSVAPVHDSNPSH